MGKAMFRISKFCIHLFGCATALFSLAALDTADASHFRVLYSFQGGDDGSLPQTALVEDRSHNLYGVTRFGGGSGCGGGGCGTAFKVTPDGVETVLYRFAGGDHDGDGPTSLMFGNDGNLYGTTMFGGGSGCSPYDGCGTVFRLASDGTEALLYSFTNFDDGYGPDGLVAKHGDLYGTTGGGGTCDSSNFGCGTVFKIGTRGRKRLLHAFAGGSDGQGPEPGPIIDHDGNLYGMTLAGGRGDCIYGGCGTIFRIAPDGTETLLYEFAGGADGWAPQGPLTRDDFGNLYGTTIYGGSYSASLCQNFGCGTVFKLAPDGTKTTLYTFAGGANGAYSYSNIIPDEAGNLYGTTVGGGRGCHKYGCGTVFRLAPDGTKTTLHSFRGKSDGAQPYGPLIESRGKLYGTTGLGGQGSCAGGIAAGCGTIFEVNIRH
jgi:uncharacterized repeat protein (TIGR03803 family)